MRNAISVKDNFRDCGANCPPPVALSGTKRDGSHRYWPIRPTPSSINRIERMLSVENACIVFSGAGYTNLIALSDK